MNEAENSRPDLGQALGRIHKKMVELVQIAGMPQEQCLELRELEELSKGFQAPWPLESRGIPQFCHIQWGAVARFLGGTGHIEPGLKSARILLGWDEDEKLRNRDLLVTDNGGEIRLFEVLPVLDPNGAPISIPYISDRSVVDEAAMAHRITRYLQGRENEINWQFRFRG